MASRSSARKPRASSQARIDAVLSAARLLLAQGGPAELSIYGVAEAAGIPPSSVYHFFPNVQALLTALTARVHEAMLDALSFPGDYQPKDWQELLHQIEARTLRVYQNDEAARQLILSNHGLVDVQTLDRQHDLRLSEAMAALFQHYFVLPALPQHLDIFDISMQLSDRLYGLSVQRFGYIHADYAEEGYRAGLAYLGLYLPRYLPLKCQTANTPQQNTD
ncbi:TetR/AcrR family transcriptional regulator [Pokkaliibacter sp. CJK22405]|uniref:TetR/AcrR family transcriptional regulator n=1 Tax=Pokkaliibacter sp. CJK22405 TaxID=3384615 RepID=UPI0039850443